MRRIVFLILSLLTLPLAAQMNNEKMEMLLSEQVDSIIGTPGRWQIVHKELPMMVITDEANDRMRIIAPIIEVDQLDKEVLLDCLAANFHTALDVKYAVSNDVLWCVFIHPLSPLSAEELSSAVDQVFYGTANFGTTYNSTPMIFGGGSEEKKPPKIKGRKI